jgi:hypothetical protein
MSVLADDATLAALADCGPPPRGSRWSLLVGWAEGDADSEGGPRIHVLSSVAARGCSDARAAASLCRRLESRVVGGLRVVGVAAWTLEVAADAWLAAVGREMDGTIRGPFYAAHVGSGGPRTRVSQRIVCGAARTRAVASLRPLPPKRKALTRVDCQVALDAVPPRGLRSAVAAVIVGAGSSARLFDASSAQTLGQQRDAPLSVRLLTEELRATAEGSRGTVKLVALVRVDAPISELVSALVCDYERTIAARKCDKRAMLPARTLLGVSGVPILSEYEGCGGGEFALDAAVKIPLEQHSVTSASAQHQQAASASGEQHQQAASASAQHQQAASASAQHQQAASASAQHQQAASASSEQLVGRQSMSVSSMLIAVGIAMISVALYQIVGRS